MNCRTLAALLPIGLALSLSLTACGGAQSTTTTTAPTANAATKTPATAVCPVSKREFKVTADTKTVVHNGKTYYMCCPGCFKKFSANPGKYVAAAAPKKPCAGACDKTKPAGAKKDCAKKGCDKKGKDCAKKDKDCGKDCDDKGAAKKDCADCAKGKPCKGDCEDKGAAKPAAKPATAAKLPAEATCPVSGKKFAPTADTKVATHNGKTYYMCCGGCAKKFAANPGKFAK
ncbi:MAG: YHS domain-containing protein [Myxococcales bacterium]|nr:YHS domain-containing protein [Myxococcales bacterium]